MFAGIIIFLVGLIFLLKDLGYITFITWDMVWPVIIMVIGLSIAFKRCHKCGMRGWHCCGMWGNKDSEQQ